MVEDRSGNVEDQPTTLQFNRLRWRSTGNLTTWHAGVADQATHGVVRRRPSPLRIISPRHQGRGLHRRTSAQSAVSEARLVCGRPPFEKSRKHRKEENRSAHSARSNVLAAVRDLVLGGTKPTPVASRHIRRSFAGDE